MKQGMEEVKTYRKEKGDAYQYQWSLKIEPEFQLPFDPSHEVMANLNLYFQNNKAELAANLRKAFSGIDRCCQYSKIDFRTSKEFINSLFLVITKA